MEIIEKLFDEIIAEAEQGQVIIDDFIYNISFHTNYVQNNQTYQDDRIVLKIRNKEQLLKLLKEYILHLNKTTEIEIKKILALIWANATWSDFENPEIFIKRNIDFLKNPLFENKQTDSIEALLNSHIEIEVKPYTQETPYYFKPTISNGVDSYELPIISYGISNDTCYIYAVQNKQQQPNTTYQKKIKRLLYKLNDGVYEQENDEYKQYKAGLSTYYPENISDVSPSSILSLTVFINELFKKDIKKIKVIPFLPIRYQAKKEASIKRANFRGKDEEEKQTILKQLNEEQLFIQNNLTQKFLRNFFRLQFHFPNIEFYSLPFEIDECLNINVSNFENTNNPILEEIIKEEDQKKK